MKTLNWALNLIYVSTLFVGTARAEGVNTETQDLVADRLERIISTMDQKDSSWLPSQQRLADVYAERARNRFMQEIEANCKDCKGSSVDRKKALAIYDKIFTKTQIKDQGRILFQMAHLHELAGENEKSIALFEKILKSKKGIYSHEVIEKSRLSLADLQYQKGDYKKALKNYQESLKTAQEQKGFVTYRIAWCQFNTDQLSLAISNLEQLAAHPELLTKETKEGFIADAGFRNDVLRDLATFYTRRAVTSKEISNFQSWIPAEDKKEMLLYFANETNRVGQKQASSEIYKQYLQSKDLNKEEKLDARVQLAQINYDKGQADESLEDFAVAAKEYKDTSCSKNEKCEELRKQMKKYVTELHRLKKSKPDQSVLKGYDIYSKTFPDDTEMSILGAQVADGLGQQQKASSLYFAAAVSAKDEKLKETALLGEISSAEKSENLQTQEVAYKHYLQLMPNGSKAFEVRYQLAHLSLSRKQFANAADQFRTLALDKTGSADLRKKSADLSLDALAQIHSDEQIEKLAFEYSSVFAKDQKEYLKIYRRALNAQIVKITNNEKSSKSDLKSALSKSESTVLTGATDQEKILHFKNNSVLAEKIQENKSLQAAYDGLLSVPSLSATEKEQTLAAYVGLYEKNLDFKSAYYTALKMKFSKLSRSEKEMKLGTLADLAGLSAERHYRAALSAGLKGSTAISLRQRLVFLSSNPVHELKKQESELAKSPSVLAETILLLFGKNKSSRGLEKAMENKAVKNLQAIRFIKKQFYYPQQENFDLKISSHKLETKSDRAFQKSIQKRLKYLKEADISLDTALKIKDYTAQVMALSTVEKENARFAEELMSSPLPAGLTEKEKAKYISLLKQQASPFVKKSNLAKFKKEQLCNANSQWISIANDLQKSRAEIQPYMAREARILSDLTTNSSMKSELQKALKNSQASEGDLKEARESVRSNPNDIQEIEKLKKLETKVGHPLMASYLEQRLGRIQNGKAL